MLCFSHDWSGDPLSKTHLMRLLARDNRVLWVNSIGYRTPSASRQDARRTLRKLAAAKLARERPGQTLQPTALVHELYLRLLKNGARFVYCPHVGSVYRQWKTGSVCTKNPEETNRRRLGIIGDAETFLRERDMQRRSA